MLSLESCHEIREPGDGRLLYAGLRVRIGIVWAEPGSIVALVNNETSSFDVRGPGMDAAVAVSDAAYGGQTVLTEAVYCRVCHTYSMHLLIATVPDEAKACERCWKTSTVLLHPDCKQAPCSWISSHSASRFL
jgi:hypothetical protein